MYVLYDTPRNLAASLFDFVFCIANSISALRSGFYWGYAGLIENILQLIRKETKRNYKIILTGGFSLLFKNSIKSKVFIDKDITMKGLIELLKVK